MQSDDGETWYWFNIPAKTQTLLVGIPRRRIGAHPPLAVLLVLLTGTVVSLTTSVFLARHLTRPLVQLSAATEQIATGDYLEPLPERGPEEIATLVRSFNRGPNQLTEWLSDSLRTPHGNNDDQDEGHQAHGHDDGHCLPELAVHEGQG